MERLELVRILALIKDSQLLIKWLASDEPKVKVKDNHENDAG